jgi:hypothetical protein
VTIKIKDMKFCSLCKRPYSKEDLEKKLKRKQEILKLALANARARGVHIGRKRENDYDKIRWLKKEGLTVRKIAEAMQCSTSTVQAAVHEKDFK